MRTPTHTGGRPKGAKNKIPAADREQFSAFCRQLCDNRDYRESLKRRLISGKVAPGVEQTVWYYAYGKPPETIELGGKNGGPVRHTVRITIVKAAA